MRSTWLAALISLFAFVPLCAAGDSIDHYPKTNPDVPLRSVAEKNFYLSVEDAYQVSFETYDFCGGEDIGARIRSFYRRLVQICPISNDVRQHMTSDFTGWDTFAKKELGDNVRRNGRYPSQDGDHACGEMLQGADKRLAIYEQQSDAALISQCFE
jgi:hypothetical protein